MTGLALTFDNLVGQVVSMVQNLAGGNTGQFIIFFIGIIVLLGLVGILLKLKK